MNTYYLIITEADTRKLGAQNIGNQLAFRRESFGGETEVHVAQTLGDAQREIDMLRDKHERMWVHDRYNPNNALIVEIQTDKPIKEIENEINQYNYKEGFPKAVTMHLPNDIKVNVTATYAQKPKAEVKFEVSEPKETKAKGLTGKIKEMKENVQQALKLGGSKSN